MKEKNAALPRRAKARQRDGGCRDAATSGAAGTEANAALSRRLVSPKSDEGGSETQAEAQHHGKGQARCGKLKCRANEMKLTMLWNVRALVLPREIHI